MKYAGYVAWILLCKLCKFGEKIYYNSGDIEFFLRDYFFWRALYSLQVQTAAWELKMDFLRQTTLEDEATDVAASGQSVTCEEEVLNATVSLKTILVLLTSDRGASSTTSFRDKSEGQNIWYEAANLFQENNCETDEVAMFENLVSSQKWQNLSLIRLHCDHSESDQVLAKLKWQ